jgi:hypothetical protein
MEFTFSKRARTLSVGLMLTGLLVLAMGYIMTTGDPQEAPMLGQRMWSDLLVNGFFFFGISLGILFFLRLAERHRDRVERIAAPCVRGHDGLAADRRGHHPSIDHPGLARRPSCVALDGPRSTPPR